MKIICSKSNLLKSVSISLKAVPSKTTMPILECILIDATTNQIKFTTNDMELGIETIVEGTIEEKGMVALNAKIFYEIIRRLPDNDVTIKTDEKFAATITCEKAKFNIPDSLKPISKEIGFLRFFLFPPKTHIKFPAVFILMFFLYSYTVTNSCSF